MRREQNIFLLLGLIADEYLKEWAGLRKSYSVVAPMHFYDVWHPEATERDLYIMEHGKILENSGRKYSKTQMLLALARAELGRADPMNIDAAKDLKERGNKAFADGSFREAKNLYTRAIDVFKRITNEMEPWKCLEPHKYALLATCLCNRAECYLRLNAPKAAQEDVVEVLQWLPRGPIPEAVVVKAYQRRERAEEALAQSSSRRPRNRRGNQQEQAGPPPRRANNSGAQARANASADEAGAHSSAAGGGAHAQEPHAGDQDQARSEGGSAGAHAQHESDARVAGARSEEAAHAGVDDQMSTAAQQEVVDKTVPMKSKQVLKNGLEVATSGALESEECYVCINLWEDITERVLVPTCRHAVCVACASALREVERNRRKAAKLSLKQGDNINCGICRRETIAHVN
jgi:tetratricopeptide (TPR) repeat protein